MAKAPSDYAPTSAIPQQRDARPVPGALQWVTDHREEYWGKWVAVGAHGLVAVADTFAELKSKRDSFEGVMISHVV